MRPALPIEPTVTGAVAVATSSQFEKQKHSLSICPCLNREIGGIQNAESTKLSVPFICVLPVTRTQLMVP